PGSQINPSASSAQAPEIHSRPSFSPIGLAIPELHAADPPAVARQIQNPAAATGANPVPHLHLLVLPVFEVHDYMIELDVAVLDTELQRSERSSDTRDDPVVVPRAVDIGAPKVVPVTMVSIAIATPVVIIPAPLRIPRQAETRHQ